MNFFHPTFLYALALAALPIIIHLINLRRHKKMYFSSLWFLKNIKEQTQQSRKIHEWLLLLLRTLLIASLVMAFAGPYIDRKQTGGQPLHIILDNTQSMQSNNNEGNLYDQAKTKAVEIFDKLDNNSKLSLHFLANGESHFGITPDKARQITAKSAMLCGQKKLNAVAAKIVEKNPVSRMIVLSDFQQNIVSPDTVFQDTNIQISLIKLSSHASNLSIDSLWFNSPLHIPNQSMQLNLRIKNHSSRNVHDLPVRIRINGDLLSAGTTEIEPQTSSIYKASMEVKKTGLLKIEALIEDIPVTFDNKYFSGIYIYPRTRIIETGSQQSEYLKSLFNDSLSFDYQYRPLKKLSLSDIEQAQCIVMNSIDKISGGIANAIYQKVQKGGNLIIIPQIKQTTQAFNKITQQFKLPEFKDITQDRTQIKQINQNHYLLKEAIEDIDDNIKLPEIGKYYSNTNTSNLSPILYNDLNDPVMFHQANGSGNIYLFTFNALHKKFATQPLFVPLFYNAAAIRGKNIIPQITCNEPTTVKVKLENKTIREKPLKIINKKHSFIPYSYQQQNSQIMALQQGQITQPGYYEVHQDDSLVTTIAANHQPKESIMQFYSEESIHNQIFSTNKPEVFSIEDDATQVLSPIQKLWKWFIVLALIIAMAEVLTIFLKKKHTKHIKKHT